LDHQQVDLTPVLDHRVDDLAGSAWAEDPSPHCPVRMGGVLRLTRFLHRILMALLADA
jgi:hypothetical protein